MKNIYKAIIGVFCALMLATSAYSANVNASTNAPVSVQTVSIPASGLHGWAITLGGVAVTPSQTGNQWGWGGELGVSKDIKIKKLNTVIGVRQSGWTTTGDKTTYTVVNEKVNVAPPCCGEDLVNKSTIVPKSVTDSYQNYRSEVFWDAKFKLLGPVSAVVGPNVSMVYGAGTPTWYVGPEAGLNADLSKNLFLYGRVNYDFEVEGSGKDGLRMATGVGVKF